MIKNRKKAAELADEILKEMTTPEERGFVCMYPDNCEICIKAAERGKTTTACEDELEDGHYKEKTDKLDGKFELGIYVAPHANENIPNQYSRHPQSNKKIWRAWIRLTDGGILGIPFPVTNDYLAKIYAAKAADIFNGELVDLEDLGSRRLKP